MCCKSLKFTDHIIGCDDIRVNAVLAPNTDYVWVITDLFSYTYQLPFTTNEEGIGVIDVSQLPEGFCNPYMKGFTLRLKQTIESCDYIEIPFIQKYDSILVEQRSGNIPKSFIGCPYVVPTAPSFHSGRIQFTGQEDQVEYQNNDLKNAVQVIVVNESGVMQEGQESNQYQFSKVTGAISFGQSISNQAITIIYFKL